MLEEWNYIPNSLFLLKAAGIKFVYNPSILKFQLNYINLFFYRGHLTKQLTSNYGLNAEAMDSQSYGIKKNIKIIAAFH